MVPLYTYNGKLLTEDNKLAADENCCCPGSGVCSCKADMWRLTEDGDQVDGGEIRTVSFGAVAVQQVMMSVGSTWEPYWFKTFGPNKTYKLEVKCQGEWEVVETWPRTLLKCQGYGNRWFTLDLGPYDLSVKLPAPSACGFCTDDNGEKSDPVLICSLTANGVAISDSVAYLFLDTLGDHEWSNLYNWEDSQGRTPARSYPTPLDEIVILGNLLTNSLDTEPALKLISVGLPNNNPGQVGISLICPANITTFYTTTFYVDSELLESGNCRHVPDAINPYDGGHIVGNCNFKDTSLLSGQVVGSVLMENFSGITGPGEVYGNCTFKNSSTHHGYVEGTSNFDNSSSCVGGKVCGNVTMHDSSVFGPDTGEGAFVMCDPELSPGVDCDYDLILLDTSTSYGATVCRDLKIGLIGNSGFGMAKDCAIGRDFIMLNGHTEGYIDVAEHVTATGGYFGGTSLIESAPGGTALTVTANLTNCTISGPSWPTDTSVSTIYGNAILSNSDNYGVIRGWVEFKDASVNEILGNVITAIGITTFADISNNKGTVTGNAAFTGNAINQFVPPLLLSGIVTGDATFTVSATNDGTVTGNATFADDSINKRTVTGNATFADDSINKGTVTGNATFTGNSINQGTVTGNATFTNSSINQGTVTGDAIFNISSKNGNDGTVGGVTTFKDTTFNQGTLGNATFTNTSRNEGSISNTATFNMSSYNIGTVLNAIFNASSYNSGTVSGNAAFNNSSYNTCSLGSVTGTVTYNGLTGYVAPHSYVLGECVP